MRLTSFILAQALLPVVLSAPLARYGPPRHPPYQNHTAPILGGPKTNDTHEQHHIDNRRNFHHENPLHPETSSLETPNSNKDPEIHYIRDVENHPGDKPKIDPKPKPVKGDTKALDALLPEGYRGLGSWMWIKVKHDGMMEQEYEGVTIRWIKRACQKVYIAPRQEGWYTNEDPRYVGPDWLTLDGVALDSDLKTLKVRIDPTFDKCGDPFHGEPSPKQKHEMAEFIKNYNDPMHGFRKAKRSAEEEAGVAEAGETEAGDAAFVSSEQANDSPSVLQEEVQRRQCLCPEDHPPLKPPQFEG